MSKNTVGPWEIVGETTITNSEHSMTIANVSSWSLTPEQVKVHSRLIAAAPELLEALRQLVDSFDPCTQFTELANARAAIFKATA